MSTIYPSPPNKDAAAMRAEAEQSALRRKLLELIVRNESLRKAAAK